MDPLSAQLASNLAEDAGAPADLIQVEGQRHFVSTYRVGDQDFYRFNPVFRDFLLRKLQDSLTPAQARERHRQLAVYFAGAQEWDSAVHQWMATGDYLEAGRVVAALAETAIAANRLETLARWIDAFPTEERDRQPWLLLHRGVVHRVKREWDAALGLYAQAVALFQEQGERRGLARTLEYTSQVLAYRGKPRLATMIAGEALGHLGPADQRSRAWILHGMGNSYFDLGQADESLRCHQEAHELFMALGDTWGEMTQSQALARALHRLGRLNEALPHYVRALEMQGLSGDINLLCWTQAGLTHLRSMRGDYADALVGLTEVVAMAQAHHYRPAEAFALSCLADIYLDLGSNRRAEICCQQALAVCADFDDEGLQIDLEFKLMEVELRRGQLGRARERGQSLAVRIAATNLHLQGIELLRQQAAVQLEEEGFQEAEQQAEKARGLAAKMGAHFHEAQACCLLARLHFRQGQLETSASWVEQMLARQEPGGYASFLLRDQKAATELLANALLCLPGRERVLTLLLRLAESKDGLASLAAEVNAGHREGDQPEVGAGPPHLASAAFLATEPATASLPTDQVDRGVPLAPTEVMGATTGEDSLAGSDLEVLLLGRMKVRQGGQWITDRAWRTSKAKELFAYLLSRPTESANRDELVEALWPEASVDAGISNFHFTLHSLRRALASNHGIGASASRIVLSGRQYRLDLPSSVWTDVQEFRTSVVEGLKLVQERQPLEGLSLLERAVELYQGDYLTDYGSSWLESERQELLASYLNALRQMARWAYLQREYDQVVHYANAILSKDRYVEYAYRLLMRTACETGSSALALRHYHELAQLVQSGLGCQPEAKTRQLCQQIQAGTYQRPSAPPVTVQPSRRPPMRLPCALSVQTLI